MKPSRYLVAILTAATLLGTNSTGTAADKDAAAVLENKVDPQAIAILNRAVEKLAGAKQFSVNAEIWSETELEEGGRAQFTKTVDVKLRRPNKVQADVKTSVPKRSFYYDGKHFALLDQQKGFYGIADAPATIDETLAKMEDDYGVSFPINDLLLSRPFGDGAAKTKAAQYLGIEPVLGVLCHHLAFQNDSIDWQAWVEDGPVAVVRKVVITPKDDGDDETDELQTTAILTKWDFTTELPDYVFTFTPPNGSAKIEFVPTKKADAEPKSSK
ncbi:MAG: DUF2092 domain-containing protein [Verrucomicrobia bacterium]|nr:DUF2092 domain-containing protein [Verrucomicrobiota bacterium]